MLYTKEQFREEWLKDDCKITFEDCADCLQKWQGIRQVRCHDPRNAVYNCLLECGMEKEAEEYIGE